MSSNKPTTSRGAFIVIEGLDRSGKSTQAAALFARCQDAGIPVKLIKFPRGMASYSRSLTLLVPRCSHTSVSNTLRLYNRHRLIPRRYASQAAAIQSTSEVSAPSFTDLGVSPSLVQALKKTFPNVQIPTKSQRKFIPAVLSGRDVFLQNDTGTGKCVDCALLFYDH